ncbi:MAG: shikimate dehydrogenase [Pyrinomonadaceae bacterium]|nr:shikimate dehydrogenase [Pyrinomonadaceae bacterium]
MNNGKICVSVCAETADELISQIKHAEESADVIEIRFDCLKDVEEENLWTLIGKTSKSFKGKLLATYRPLEQGGKKNLSQTEREKFWKHARIFEVAALADLEQDFDIEIIYSFRGRMFERIIKSFHDFSKVPENLDNLCENLSKTADIIKIAVQTSDITDSIAIWKLLEKAKAENKKIIPIAMGESGKWTRILGLAHGAFMTYASLGSGNETAPGQISAKDLIEVYRAKELDENTNVYGILGSNTSVSMSPYIHNEAFKFHKLNSVFVPLQVHNLDEFIKRMVKPETREIELNFKGFSVTIPHKQAIIKHLDFIDETAKAIGAVNTVKIVDGKLYGYNTDAQGFIEPLLNSYGDLQRTKIAVIGAGGAARACVYALRQQGAKVTVFARDLEKSKSFAEEFAVDLQELPKTKNQRSKTDFSDFDILVNTTPLGMKGKGDGETPAAAEQLKGLHLVYDLVYIPFQTPLMTEADKSEIPKIGGLAMLIAQAVEQQKIWTGLAAPMKEMSRAALERLR